MPMGIDDDYDGKLNADDPTPEGGPMDKIKQLMQALAALLQPQAQPADQAAPADIAGAGSGANNEILSALLEKLAGARQPMDSPPGSPPAMPVGAPPALAAGTPEDDQGEDQSVVEDDMRGGKSFPEANPDVPATKAKGAMSKLAKARAGK